ncbi:hypothetical protein ACJX0J_011682, partial [Zea mays]
GRILLPGQLTSLFENKAHLFGNRVRTSMNFSFPPIKSLESIAYIKQAPYRAIGDELNTLVLVKVDIRATTIALFRKLETWAIVEIILARPIILVVESILLELIRIYGLSFLNIWQPIFA